MDIAALITQDGDARIAIDPCTAANQYLCPPLASRDQAIFSSCTASPLSERGLRAVLACESRLSGSEAARHNEAAAVAARIANYFGIADCAQVLLSPSGTDATLLAMRLIAAEHPDQPLVSITASPSETGSGVPWAAGGRCFLGAAKGELLPGFSARNLSVSIALRDACGTPRPQADLARAFLAASRSAPGHPVLHLVDGTKTGLCLTPKLPIGTEAIVDACQGRIAPARVRRYLQRGWPVLITGSKFYGGPAFSGAVLWPLARGLAPVQPTPSRGLLLRWHAALAEMEVLSAIGDEELGQRMRHLGAAITARIAATPGLQPLQTSCGGAAEWQSLPSIFTFTLHNEQGGLDAQALRAAYRTLALQGVLLGQPVSISPRCTALRLAIGARDLIDGAGPAKLDRVFAALDGVLMPSQIFAAAE